MKKSYITILLLLMVMILGISAVSAADIGDSSDSDVLSVDETTIDEVVSADAVDEVQTASEDTEVLTDDGDASNFTALQYRIDSSNTICYIMNDYKKAEGDDVVTISKNISIIARGGTFTIDANNNGGIFKINPGVSVYLSGVTLVNGNSDYGAAIYNEGDLVLDGCTFSNNVATQKGGAIYNTATLDINDCILSDNIATYRGGAIYNEGTLTVTGSTIDSNDITFRAKNDDNGGAAIYNNGGTINLDDVEVTNNLKDIVIRDGNDGHQINAAIFTNGDATIANSYIANNTGSWGAGVYVTNGATLTVSNTVFEGNNATFGAGIYDEGAVLNVDNCTFNDNLAIGVGSAGTSSTQAGAILVMAQGASATITNSRFNRNSAKTGGAVSISQATGSVLIDDCEFTENTASYEGGAIYNYIANGAALTVTDSTFTDNTAANWGNAISNDGDLSLSGNTISGDGAEIGNWLGEIDTQYQITILDGQSHEVTVPTYQLTAIVTDDNGNKINDHNFIFLVGDEEVQGTYYTSEGMYIAEYTFTAPGTYVITTDYENAEIINSSVTFIAALSSLKNIVDTAIANGETSVDLSYGFQYYEPIDGVDYPGIVISEDFTINGNGLAIDGGNAARLFNVTNGATLTLNNIILTNGKADKGAAVYVNNGASLVADNIDFIENVAVYRGGAIYSEGSVSVSNSVIDSNDITFRAKNDDNGGAAIYNLGGTLTVTNTEITNNLKDIVIRDGNDGHLINAVIFTNGDATITNSYIANNTGSWGAGVYVTNGATLTVSNTVFEGNNATFGAAIYAEGATINVNNCTFNDNAAVGIGSAGTSNTQAGAILAMSGSTATIADSKFNRNSAKVGGAVSFAGASESVIDNCTFTENTGYNEGGAIYSWTGTDATVTVKDSTFIDNVAPFGSAISNDGDMKLSENTITGDSSIPIGNYYGTIDSETFVKILNGETITTATSNVTLIAYITDDNGNSIVDNNFVFIVDDNEVISVYNSNSGAHLGEYTLTNPGTYEVTTNTYPADHVTAGTIVYTKGTYTELQSLIDDAEEGSTINLSHDIVYNDGFDGDNFPNGIIVNKTITIVGAEGVEICGSDLRRVFNVTNGATLTLKDVTVCDGLAEEGAGIYVESGASLSAQNVIFTQNVANTRGGAIYSEGDVEISDSIIKENYITKRDGGSTEDKGGAALFNNGGTATLDNVQVVDNLKDYVNGNVLDGAVVAMGETTITNSYFANNYGRYGGAITQTETDKTLTVENTTFEDNVAIFGAAIYDSGAPLVVKDCKFYNNSGIGPGSPGTSNSQGGAILVMGTTASADIIESEFINNTADLGGAVSLAGIDEDSIIDNCTFIENTATTNGGAVYYWSNTETTDLEIADSTFTGNSAQDGGAVYFSGHSDLSVTGSEFTDNTATYGGAIENEGFGGLTVDDSKFIENAATASGGAIISSGNTSVSNSIFADNEANTANTNAIYMWASDNTLALSNNTITGSDDAQILAKSGTSVITPLKVKILDNATYNIHMSSFNLNATVTDDNDNLIIDSTFRFVVGDKVVDSISIDPTTGIYNATFTPTETGTFVVSTNLEDASEVLTGTLNVYRTFTDLANIIAGAQAGDTIVLDGDYTYNPEFDADLIAGITIDKSITIDGNGSTISGSDVARLFYVAADADFTLKNATLINAKADKGAAVYVENAGQFEAYNIIFFNNTATYKGGAVYSEGSVNIVDSVFDSNDITFRTANDENGGAAVYNYNGVLSIVDSNITNNLKDIVIRNGNAGDLLVGVVVTSGETVIKGSYFANNTGSWGGAISSLGYLNDNEYTLTVMDSKFEGNNATFGGAIFVESAKLIVDNSTFENNKGVGVGSSGTSNTQGGAISISPGKAEITDSTFIGNSANIGGAVSLPGVDSDSIIENCTFTDNTASVDGGAVYFWTNGAGVTITDSEFVNNTAPYGGAIENEGIGDLTVDNCIFTENTASSRGGAIISSGNTVVSNSVFTDNEALGNTNAIYLYNTGTTLELSNNTITGDDKVQILVKSGIEIDSQLNATFLGNQTVPAYVGDIFILNATLTDDKGNFIYDADFRFSIDGETADEILFDDETGLYTIGYYIGTAGPKVISTNYELDKLVKYTGILDVPLANVTEFTVKVENIIDGENATVVVTLIGVNETGLTSDVKVIINNTEYTVNVVNGTGNITIEGLAHGQYPVVAMFTDDPNYNSAINSTVFYVKSAVTITIEGPAENVTYGEPVTIKVTVNTGDDVPFNGLIYLGYYETEFAVVINAGEGSYTFDANTQFLSVGEHEFIAGFEGNNDYNASESNRISFNVTVNELNPEDVNVVIKNSNEYGEGINVTITSPVDGNYTVNINGTVATVEVVNGVGSAIVEPENPGIYNATVTLDKEGYSYENTTDYFAYLITPEFNVVITGTYPNAEISITGPAGTYHVDIGERETINITREESGLPTVYTIEGIDAGNYTAFVSFDTHDEYYGNYKDINFTVAKADSKVTIEPITNVTYGNPVVIVYNIDNETDFVTISITKVGSDTPEEFSDLQGTITANLPAGTYTISINNGESENYNESENLAEFTVAKAEALTITVEGDLGVMGGATVNVTVGDDATGYIIVDNNGVKDVYELVNGSYAFEIYDLQAGEYNITITYLGDDNYNKTEDTKVLNIPKSATTPEITGYTPNIYGGEQAVVNISMDNDFATGVVRIYVDGEEVGFGILDDNANATLLINDLANGTHTIGIKYAGDDNFNESGIINVTVNVVKADSKVTIDPITNVTVGNDVVIYYKIENNTNNIKIEFTNPNDEITVEYELYEDKIVVHNLAAGDYEVKVYNIENDFYNTDAAVALFTVNKIDVSDKISIDPETITYGENATVIVSGFPEAATGNVTIKVGNKNYTAKVEGGQAVVEISGLAAGTYEDLAVEYTGDSIYNATNVNCAIYVNKAKSEVFIYAIGDQPYPGNFTIGYNIENKTDVNITVNGPNGEEIEFTTDEEGNIVLTNLVAGEYYITIENKENENFTKSEAVESFKVYKADPTFTSNVTEDAKVGENVTITVKAPVDATGNVTVLVDGEIVATNLPVINGVATINVTGLAAGHHSYEVTYNGDDNYEIASDVNSFDVAKAETKVTIEVNESTIGVMGGSKVNITVSNNVAGYLAIDNNGVTSVVEITDGKYSFEIYDLQAGEYYINATFLGNDNYLKSNATKQFEIPKSAATPDVVYTPEIKGGEKAELNVTMDNNLATGVLRIYVDGEEVGFAVLDENYANATVFINDLANGTHTIGVKYAGNDNFNESDIVNVTVTVVKADSKVTIDPITNVTVGNDVVIYYKVENYTSIKLEFTNPNDEITVDYELFEDRIVVHNLAAGDYEVKVYNMENDFYNTDAAVALFTVNKIDVSDKISIDPETITYGENATVIVSGFPEAATGNVTIKVGNKNYTAKVEQGQATIEISGLAAGTYEDLAVEYTGDDVYNATNANCAIYVNKAKSEVFIYAIGDQPYPGNFTIGYNIENKTDVNITVNGPNGEEIEFTTDEEGNIVLTNLVAGEYYITIENKENENFTGFEAVESFKVYKADPTFTSNVTEDAKVGENVTITVKAPVDATGNVTVIVDGEIVDQALPITNGVATINVTGLAAGHHSYEVTYNGDDNYEIASDINSFDVVKVTPEIIIEDIAGTVGTTVSATVTITGGDATGYILYDNVAYKLENGQTTIQVGISEAGMQSITVTYLGDDKYANGTGVKAFNAAKASTTINLADSEITVLIGNDVEVKYSIDPSVSEGNVTVWINDEVYYNEEITQSIGSVIIGAEELQTDDIYTVKVQYIGTTNYEDSNVETLLIDVADEVVKFDISVPENTTTPVFNITVPTDATGLLLVDIDGKHYYAEVENGTASITVPGLEPGNYTANVTYTGDDLYLSLSETFNVTVPANADENSITIPEGASALDPTFSINLPSDATGYFEVDVDGKKYVVPVENGTASITVPGLSAGDHNVTVKYSGDSKYNSISKSTTLKLKEPVAKLSENKYIKVVYSGKATYKVRLTLDGKPAAGKTVTINFNGKNYNVVTDSKGYATLKLNTKVKPKKYTVTATYKDVKVTSKVKVKHVIKAKNKKAKKSKKLKLKVKLKKVDGKVLKNKKVKLKFKGKKYKATTNKKGKAKFTIKKKVMKKLKKGKKYKYKVFYGKDKVTKKIKVKK